MNLFWSMILYYANDYSKYTLYDLFYDALHAHGE